MIKIRENAIKQKKLKPFELGKSGEKAALHHLKRNKYSIAEKRFRLLRGEIDIIAYDKKTLVFIEVKTRSNRFFGLPEEAVSYRKQQQIKKIASGYLAIHKIEDILN